ncbi:hypothetical protein LIER_29266 [Lithospermum erythrorhizon]|uniref:Uncharacterized protein n=1 Tax=Lithospermum erythrorhizon TaxID=34254 RepID=A0AAV3RNQ1_LITER
MSAATPAWRQILSCCMASELVLDVRAERSWLDYCLLGSLVGPTFWAGSASGPITHWVLSCSVGLRIGFGRLGWTFVAGYLLTRLTCWA